MSISTLKRRISQLEGKYAEQVKATEGLKTRLDDAGGADYDQLSEGLALARMKVDVMREALDKAKDDLKSTEVRLKSSEYKDAVKKMTGIKSDNEKTVQDIDETVDHLVDLIEGLQKSCKDYDRLSVMVEGRSHPYGHFYSYGWIVMLKTYLDKLSHDYIYQTR